MPKFYRQNKKRIDPRYFLEETTNRDADIDGDQDVDIDDVAAVVSAAQGRPEESAIAKLEAELGLDIRNMDEKKLETLKNQIAADKFGQEFFQGMPHGQRQSHRDNILNDLWSLLRAKYNISHPYDSQEGDVEDDWMGGRSIDPRPRQGVGGPEKASAAGPDSSVAWPPRPAKWR